MISRKQLIKRGLVLGNCMDPKTGLPAIEDKAVDHIITDPPFSAHVHAGNRRGWEEKDGKKLPTKSMPMAFEALSDDELPALAKEFVRVCSGWILVFCAIEQVGLWKAALELAGAKRRNSVISTGKYLLTEARLAEMVKTLTKHFAAKEIAAALRLDAESLIWTKPNCAPKFAGDGPSNAAEAIALGWAGKGMSVWNAGGSYGHYHFPVETLNRRHETQKPLPLMRQLLIDFTQPGQLVLDPFAGGGATPIACVQLSREWAGYELDPLSHAKAIEGILGTAPLHEMQQTMLHRRRKDRAYAGVRPKPTALPVQTEMDYGVKKKAKTK